MLCTNRKYNSFLILCKRSQIMSKTLLMQAKSALASAFLRDNIKIEHSSYVNEPTYDTFNKRIILPNWEEISSDLYDTFCGMATASATWTPNGQISKNKNAIRAVCKDNEETGEIYLRTVEEARVQNALFNKFHGYKKRFKNGYQEFADNAENFEYDIDIINEASLVDRINMFTKFGDKEIEFTEDEQKILERLDGIRSFKDSVELAQDILEEDINQQKQSTQSASKNGEGEGEGGEGGTGEGGVDLSKLGQLSKNFEDAKKDMKTGKDHNHYQYTKPKDAQNQKSNHQNLATGQKCSDALYDDKIAPFKDLMHTQDATTIDLSQSRKNALKLSAKFNIALNAKIYEKTREYKTGVLNTNRLYNYKNSDDIFLSDELVPEGKNHGATIMVDCSGSMSGNISDAFRQVLDLVLFCKYADIPYRAYGFTSGNNNLFEIIRSDYSRNKKNSCMNDIFNVINDGSGALSMSGTPLLESMELIKDTNAQFIFENQIEVHNVFIITDGQGNNYSKYTGQGAVIEDKKLYVKGKNSWEGAFILCEIMRQHHRSTNISWFHVSDYKEDFSQYGLKSEYSKKGLDVFVARDKNTPSPDVLFRFDENNFYSNYEMLTTKLVQNMKSKDDIFG